MYNQWCLIFSPSSKRTLTMSSIQGRCAVMSVYIRIPRRSSQSVSLLPTEPSSRKTFPPHMVSGDGQSSSLTFPFTCADEFLSACAGKSMADASVWIAIASILAVFRMRKAKDSAGNIIEVPDEYIDGLVTSVFLVSTFAPFSLLF